MIKHIKNIQYIIRTTKKGYDRTAFLFYIPALGTLIATDLSYIGIPIVESGAIAGLTTIVGFAFFYSMGHIHNHINNRNKKKQHRR